MKCGVQSGYFVVQLPGEHLAITAPWAGQTAAQRDVDARFSEDVEQMREKRHVAPIADFVGHGSALDRVAERGHVRHDRRAREQHAECKISANKVPLAAMLQNEF